MIVPNSACSIQKRQSFEWNTETECVDPVYFEMEPGKEGFIEWEVLRFRCWQRAIELADCDHCWEISDNVDRAYFQITGSDDEDESDKMYWQTVEEFK